MMLSVRQRTNHEIGWHRHPNGSWIWGVMTNDGCALCELAERWILSQRDWRTEVAKYIRERRAVWSEPIVVKESKKTENEEPKEERVIRIVPSTEPSQLSISDTNVVLIQSENENEEEPQIPQQSPPEPKPEPTFKLTNPDAHSITRGGRRRRR